MEGKTKTSRPAKPAFVKYSSKNQRVGVLAKAAGLLLVFLHAVEDQQPSNEARYWIEGDAHRQARKHV